MLETIMNLDQLKQNLELLKESTSAIKQIIHECRSDSRIASTLTAKDLRGLFSISTRISTFDVELDKLIEKIPEKKNNISEAEFNKIHNQFLLEANDFYKDDLEKALIEGLKIAFPETNPPLFVTLISGHMKDMQSFLWKNIKNIPFQSSIQGKHHQKPFTTLPIYAAGTIELYDPSQKMTITDNKYENNLFSLTLNCPKNTTKPFFYMLKTTPPGGKTFYHSWMVDPTKPETETRLYIHDFSDLAQKQKNPWLFLNQVGVKDEELAKSSFIYPPELSNQKPGNILSLSKEIPMVVLKLPKRVICITKDSLNFTTITKK